MKLIDRDKFIVAMAENMFTDKTFHEIVQEQPIIDAKPVIHSYWIERTEPIGEDDVDTFVMCVNCRNTFDNVSTYCPCCGALMDGKEQS